MALIKCAECSRDISDQASSCPGCGAPVVVSESTSRAPEKITLSGGQFVATREMVAALVKSAIQSASYRIDAADDAAGTVTFTTGMTMGSWTGVSGTIVYTEVEPYHFAVTGAAKQNVRGGQMVALDLFGEAKSKVDKVIDEMKRQVSQGKVGSEPAPSSTGCAVVLLAIGLMPSAWAISHFI